MENKINEKIDDNSQAEEAVEFDGATVLKHRKSLQATVQAAIVVHGDITTADK